jgi:hypothetical protein
MALTLVDLEQRRSKLPNQLAELGDFRSGSIGRLILSGIESAWAIRSFAANTYLLVRASIEAGCKTVASSRLKRSGMFWTVRGADAILALRCCHLNGEFEDFWEGRRVA